VHQSAWTPQRTNIREGMHVFFAGITQIKCDRVNSSQWQISGAASSILVRRVDGFSGYRDTLAPCSMSCKGRRLLTWMVREQVGATQMMHSPRNPVGMVIHIRMLLAAEMVSM
jgi:hypothetical protein